MTPISRVTGEVNCPHLLTSPPGDSCSEGERFFPNLQPPPPTHRRVEGVHSTTLYGACFHYLLCSTSPGAGTGAQLRCIPALSQGRTKGLVCRPWWLCLPSSTVGAPVVESLRSPPHALCPLSHFPLWASLQSFCRPGCWEALVSERQVGGHHAAQGHRSMLSRREDTWS